MNPLATAARSCWTRSFAFILVLLVFASQSVVAQDSDGPPKAIDELAMMLESSNEEGVDDFLSNWVAPDRLEEVGKDRFRDALLQIIDNARGAQDLAIMFNGTEFAIEISGPQSLVLSVGLNDANPPQIASLRLEMSDGAMSNGSPFDEAISAHVRAVEAMIGTDTDEAILEFVNDRLSSNLRSSEGDFAWFSRLKEFRDAVRSAQGIGISRTDSSIEMSFEGPNPRVLRMHFSDVSPFLISGLTVSGGQE